MQSKIMANYIEQTYELQLNDGSNYEWFFVKMIRGMRETIDIFFTNVIAITNADDTWTFVIKTLKLHKHEWIIREQKTNRTTSRGPEKKNWLAVTLNQIY